MARNPPQLYMGKDDTNAIVLKTTISGTSATAPTPSVVVLNDRGNAVYVAEFFLCRADGPN